MPPYVAAIFDLDGTLIDTERLFIDAAVTAAQRLSLPFDRAFMASLAGQSDAEGFRIMQAHVGPATDLEPFQTEWSALVRTSYAQGIPLMRGADDLLASLAARRFPRAVATNSLTASAHRKLAHAGIAHHFDPGHVIGVDRVARAKPAPDLFLAAADTLRAEPAALHRLRGFRCGHRRRPCRRHDRRADSRQPSRRNARRPSPGRQHPRRRPRRRPDLTGGPGMDDATRTELEAAAFRALRDHLMVQRPDVQNIDLMTLAGFCRNCLSRWYMEAANAQGIPMTKDEARETFYGMPYADWVAQHQTDADAGKKAAFDQAFKANVKP